MSQFLWICFAGALGTGSRYLILMGTQKFFGGLFPYGTLIVNLLGCFLMTAIMQAALTTSWLSPSLRQVLTTGFMGGLTTYSSFNYETMKLFHERAWGASIANFALTTFGCFFAGLAGLVVIKRFWQ